jgi:hypothetical protein
MLQSNLIGVGTLTGRTTITTPPACRLRTPPSLGVARRASRRRVSRHLDLICYRVSLRGASKEGRGGNAERERPAAEDKSKKLLPTYGRGIRGALYPHYAHTRMRTTPPPSPPPPQPPRPSCDKTNLLDEWQTPLMSSIHLPAHHSAYAGKRSYSPPSQLAPTAKHSNWASKRANSAGQHPPPPHHSTFAARPPEKAPPLAPAI